MNPAKVSVNTEDDAGELSTYIVADSVKCLGISMKSARNLHTDESERRGFACQIGRISAADGSS